MIDQPFDTRHALEQLAGRLDEYATHLAQFGDGIGEQTASIATVLRMAADELAMWRRQTAEALNERDQIHTNLMSAFEQIGDITIELRTMNRQLEQERHLADLFWQHLATPVGDDDQLDHALETYEALRNDHYRPA